jgi:hypothetical protein
LVFEKSANFFAENRQKSQKIVIITSTPVRRYFVFFSQNVFALYQPLNKVGQGMTQDQGCQILLCSTHQIITKFYKNTPNGYKNFPLQGILKYIKNGIFWF